MAEEIVQDSFLKVWLNRHQLTGMVNFGGWLYRIASNLTYDALRKAALQKKRKRTVAGQMAEHQSDSPFTSTETLLLESQYARLVQEALGTLGERQLQAFRLVKLEGLSREEAASRMKISLSSLKTHLAVSLQKIRAYCISRLDALGVLIFLWANR
jgi:RNA polymerase sigma-70 factor (ECF subfamily)